MPISELEVQNPAPAPDETTAPVPVPKADDISTLPESWQVEIKNLRKEAADKRTKLTAYEKAEEDRKAATLSDIEKANDAATKAADRAAALEAKLLAKEAMAALEKAHMIDSELAFLAIKDKIVTENGEATNLDELVAELVKNKPHLVKAADPTKPVVPDTKSTNVSTTPSTAPKKAAGRF